MFTGLITHQATVICNEGSRLALRVQSGPAHKDFDTREHGESIAVNGVCLTLLPSDSDLLLFDLSPETRQRTTLIHLNVGDAVNLERALLASARFGGHYVSGHVDTTAYIKKITVMDAFVEITIAGFEASAGRYLLPKGSIALDGVSLTINDVHANAIKVMLVPHTLASTTFHSRVIGDHVNVEFDYFTRIIAEKIDSILGFAGKNVP